MECVTVCHCGRAQGSGRPSLSSIPAGRLNKPRGGAYTSKFICLWDEWGTGAAGWHQGAAPAQTGCQNQLLSGEGQAFRRKSCLAEELRASSLCQAGWSQLGCAGPLGQGKSLKPGSAGWRETAKCTVSWGSVGRAWGQAAGWTTEGGLPLGCSVVALGGTARSEGDALAADVLWPWVLFDAAGHVPCCVMYIVFTSV